MELSCHNKKIVSMLRDYLWFIGAFITTALLFKLIGMSLNISRGGYVAAMIGAWLGLMFRNRPVPGSAWLVLVLLTTLGFILIYQ